MSAFLPFSQSRRRTWLAATNQRAAFIYLGNSAEVDRIFANNADVAERLGDLSIERKIIVILTKVLIKTSLTYDVITLFSYVAYNVKTLFLYALVTVINKFSVQFRNANSEA